MNSIRILIGFKQELKWDRDLPESEDSEGTGDDECVDCWLEGTGYEPEGTLAGGEGSGTLPPPTTEDEDFEFVDERQTLKPHTDSSLERFGKKTCFLIFLCHMFIKFDKKKVKFQW